MAFFVFVVLLFLDLLVVLRAVVVFQLGVFLVVVLRLVLLLTVFFACSPMLFPTELAFCLA